MGNESEDIDAARRRALLGGSALVGLASSSLLAACGGSPSGSAPASSSSGSTSSSGGNGSAPVIAISGGNFVDGTGAVFQPRGSSLSGFEDSAILGVAAPDSSGGAGQFGQSYGPNPTKLAAWKMNCLRIPLNEASWLGYACYDATANGTGTKGWHTTALGNLNGTASAGATYQQNIINQVAALNSIGCAVVLDLHWSNPGLSAPVGQDSMANQDHSIDFWTSVASVFGYPNGTHANRSVMFELFNEPYVTSWSVLMNGGFVNSYMNYGNSGALGGPLQVLPYPVSAVSGSFLAGEAFTSANPTGVTGTIHAPPYTNATSGYAASGSTFLQLRGASGQGSIVAGTVLTGSVTGATATISSASYGFYVAGFAQLIAAIRATGAINPCLCGGLGYNSDLSGFAANYPANMDTTAPANFSAPSGWPGGTRWVPQVGATWHPYPADSTSVSAASVANGGSGYVVGDTITLPIPVKVAYANSVWGTPCTLAVTSVAGGAVATVSVQNGGVYGPTGYQSAGVGQASTLGSGSGATFDLTIPASSYSWASIPHLANVQALQTSPGIPVVITETGDFWSYTEAGLTGAPWFSALASWCDTNHIGMMPWSYNPPYVRAGSGSSATASQSSDPHKYITYYIVDSSNTPTPGFGQTVYQWMTTHP